MLGDKEVIPTMRLLGKQSTDPQPGLQGGGHGAAEWLQWQFTGPAAALQSWERVNNGAAEDSLHGCKTRDTPSLQAQGEILAGQSRDPRLGLSSGLSTIQNSDHLNKIGVHHAFQIIERIL